MVFENHRKSLIQHCERSELRLQKFMKKCQNGPFGESLKTVLPDIFYRTKSGDKCQYWNTQMGQFGGFSNIVYTVWMEKEKGRLDLQTHWHFESDRIWRRKWRPLLGWYISRKMVTDEIFFTKWNWPHFEVQRQCLKMIIFPYIWIFVPKLHLTNIHKYS